MGSLSIRGVDERLATLLKEMAVVANKSVNQFVLEMLRKHVGLEKSKRYTAQYDDLDHLFGSWTEDEFMQIQKKIDSERQIDEDVWK